MLSGVQKPTSKLTIGSSPGCVSQWAQREGRKQPWPGGIRSSVSAASRQSRKKLPRRSPSCSLGGHLLRRARPPDRLAGDRRDELQVGVAVQGPTAPGEKTRTTVSADRDDVGNPAASKTCSRQALSSGPPNSSTCMIRYWIGAQRVLEDRVARAARRRARCRSAGGRVGELDLEAAAAGGLPAERVEPVAREQLRVELVLEEEGLVERALGRGRLSATAASAGDRRRAARVWCHRVRLHRLDEGTRVAAHPRRGAPRPSPERTVSSGNGAEGQRSPGRVSAYAAFRQRHRRTESLSSLSAAGGSGLASSGLAPACWMELTGGDSGPRPPSRPGDQPSELGVEAEVLRGSEPHRVDLRQTPSSNHRRTSSTKTSALRDGRPSRPRHGRRSRSCACARVSEAAYCMAASAQGDPGGYRLEEPSRSQPWTRCLPICGSRRPPWTCGSRGGIGMPSSRMRVTGTQPPDLPEVAVGCLTLRCSPRYEVADPALEGCTATEVHAVRSRRWGRPSSCRRPLRRRRRRG